VSLHVWLAFGAVAVPIMIARFDVAIVLHAVLSLTVVRMIPAALARIGRGFHRNTVLFVGWFGPRGLASLVFALLALEEFGTGADQAVAVIALTVLLSVIAHGVSAAPLASRYGRAAEASLISNVRPRSSPRNPTPGTATPTRCHRGRQALSQLNAERPQISGNRTLGELTNAAADRTPR
jgi:NhaP-type Na+/H+ or K+/H+ antiporter